MNIQVFAPQIEQLNRQIEELNQLLQAKHLEVEMLSNQEQTALDIISKLTNLIEQNYSSSAIAQGAASRIDALKNAVLQVFERQKQQENSDSAKYSVTETTEESELNYEKIDVNGIDQAQSIPETTFVSVATNTEITEIQDLTETTCIATSFSKSNSNQLELGDLVEICAISDRTWNGASAYVVELKEDKAKVSLQGHYQSKWFKLAELKPIFASPYRQDNATVDNQNEPAFCDDNLAVKEQEAEGEEEASQIEQLSQAIYRHDNKVIIGFSNQQRASSWGRCLKERMLLCDRTYVESGKRRLTEWKHELHIEGMADKDSEDLAATFNFKHEPEKAFKEVGRAIPSLPLPVSAYTKEQPIDIEEIAPGDIVRSHHGQYEVMEVVENPNPKRGYLVKCICRSHDSFAQLVGQQFDVPASQLYLVMPAKKNAIEEPETLTQTEKVETEADKEEETLSFKVGQQVKIESMRQGEEFYSLIGTVTNVGTVGCAVKVGTRIKMFFPDEIKPVATTANAA